MEVEEQNSVLERFDQFCHHTNLHAYVYLRRNNPMPNIDRISWICIILTVLVGSGFVMWDVWQDWLSDPFVVVYDPHVKTIWEIPFPAVTICSVVGVKRSKFDLYNTTNTKKLYFSSLICRNKDFFDDLNLSIEQSEMKDFYDFLKSVSPTCHDLLRKCSWQGKQFECCQQFSPVITDLGLCFAFNSLPSTMLFSNDTFVLK